jgi:hypothetical protein
MSVKGAIKKTRSINVDCKLGLSHANHVKLNSGDIFMRPILLKHGM